MAAGPENDKITDKVAKDPSSKTESTASDHPTHTKDDEKHGDKVEFRHHTANPGPAIKNIDVPQEDTREDRAKRAEELNRK